MHKQRRQPGHLTHHPATDRQQDVDGDQPPCVATVTLIDSAGHDSLALGGSH